MKKIIILIAMLCSFGFCFDEYNNKALLMLGNNCSLEESTNELQHKVFFCDSGFIAFDFVKEEAMMQLKYSNDSHKREIVISFNRGWIKRKQTHKNKSVIMWLIDEFFTPIYSEELKWSGNIHELYSDFKEKVFYKTESLHYHFDTDGKPVCDTGYYWTKYGDRCTK